MEFKINKQTRIKIPKKKLRESIRDTYGYFTEFRLAFQKESGLKQTSVRYDKYKRDDIFYFKVEDIQKYMVAKIKYGI
jgi:hypothetical protein